MAKVQSAADVRWQDKAKCSGSDMDFIPMREDDKTLAFIRSRYCNGCPVWAECLAYALVYRAQGYWGGTSTGERTLLGYPRNRVKCPACKCKSVVSVEEHQICQACGISWIRTGTEGTISHDDGSGDGHQSPAEGSTDGEDRSGQPVGIAGGQPTQPVREIDPGRGAV